MSVLAKKEFPRLEVVPPNQAPKAPPSLERLWTIELLYGKHSAYSQLTYAAKFTTKLVGGASATYLVIELRERFEEILRELNVFGVLERADLLKAIDYITELKIHGVFREVANLEDELETEAGDESHELFELIATNILSELDLYPLASSDSFTSASPGVILDTENYRQKYGADVVGITSDTLLDILGLENNHQNAKRLQEILRSFARLGYLVKRSGQNRLQEQIRPNANDKAVKRLYLLRIPGLLARACEEGGSNAGA